MTEIADQLNQKLAATEAERPAGGRAKSSVSVDLDNLFSFLSDLNSGQSSVVNEIRENLEELELTVLEEVRSQRRELRAGRAVLVTAAGNASRRVLYGRRRKFPGSKWV